MKFPSFAQALQSLVIAVIVAVLGFLLFPLLGLENATGQKAFVLTLACGSFIGGLLNTIEFGARKALAPESGESMTIFVGNLAFKASQDELRELFTPYGTVHNVRIMKDRATRRPRGFAFVEMDRNHAPDAIKSLDGTEFLGRKLRVNEGVERNQKAA
ncbi:MAG: RNA recognition motif domain-containing protein [Pseudomonadota bacterium]